MKVSVILTTYNRPDALTRVLDGLLSQTCLPDEILIADDGSGQATGEALAPYLNRSFPRICHIWQEDKGFRAAMARNRAILASSGDYLILLDGDCVPSPFFVADHKALACRGTFFQGKRVLVNERAVQGFSAQTIRSFPKLLWMAATGRLSNRHHLLRLPFLPAFAVSKLSGVRSCNMGLFRTDVVAVNGFNLDFEGWGREDTEFVIRLFRYGLKRREHPFRAICFHLWHPENSRESLARNDQLLETARQGQDYFCKNGMDRLSLAERDPGEKG